jgi:integrase
MRAHGRIKQTEFEKQRRALTADEVRRLLEATQNGIRHHKMQPYARYLLYRLALETGLRMGEIRSLTVSSFDFRAKPPTVHVEPADTKGKEPADMILSPGTAQALQEHLQGKEPQDRAFRMPPSRHTVDMLKKDLEAAGVPYSLNGKDADCHSLRHTFITNLCLAGVHPAVAQKLARHSSITLTMKYYTHVLRESEISAMQRLHDLSSACLSDAQVRTIVDASGHKNSDIRAKTA